MTLTETLPAAAANERSAAMKFVPAVPVVSLIAPVTPRALPLIVQPLDRKVIELKAVLAARSLLTVPGALGPLRGKTRLSPVTGVAAAPVAALDQLAAVEKL